MRGAVWTLVQMERSVESRLHSLLLLSLHLLKTFSSHMYHWFFLFLPPAVPELVSFFFSGCIILFFSFSHKLFVFYESHNIACHQNPHLRVVGESCKPDWTIWYCLLTPGGPSLPSSVVVSNKGKVETLSVWEPCFRAQRSQQV